MRNKSYYFIISFLIIFLIYGVYLFNVLNKSKDLGLSNTLLPTSLDVPGGEAILDEIEKNSVVPFERVSLGRVWVKGVRKYFSENDKTPMVDLDLGFKSGGAQSSFTVTLVGEVYHAISSLNNSERNREDRGMVDVHSIDYVKGEWLKITLAFIPKTAPVAIEDLSNFCILENGPICTYLPLGFGTAPLVNNSLNPNFIEGGRKFLPSEVAVWYLSRNLVDPKVVE